MKLKSTTHKVTVGTTEVTGYEASSRSSSKYIGNITAGQTVVMDIYNSQSSNTANFYAMLGTKVDTSTTTNNDVSASLTAGTAYQIVIPVTDISSAQNLYVYNDQSITILSIGVKNTTETDTTYAVTGEITNGSDAIAGKTCGVLDSSNNVVGSAWIDSDGVNFSTTKLPVGDYTLSADYGDYKLSGTIAVTADGVTASATATSVPKYAVSGSVTGTGVSAADGKTLTITNSENSDITATITISGSTYSADTQLVAGTYKVSGFIGNAYTVSDTITVGDSCTDITVTKLDTMTASFDKSFGESDTGTALGDGVYVVTAGSYTADTTFSVNGRTGYLSCSGNPSVTNNVPTSGMALKFVADDDVDGTLYVDYYNGADKSKDLYTSTVTSDGTATSSKESISSSASGTLKIDVTGGCVYYVYFSGTSNGRFYGVSFNADGISTGVTTDNNYLFAGVVPDDVDTYSKLNLYMIQSATAITSTAAFAACTAPVASSGTVYTSVTSDGNTAVTTPSDITSGSRVFAALMEGLTAGNTYYAVAAGINGDITTYGNIVTITK